MELEKLLRKHWTLLRKSSTNYSDILSRLYTLHIISLKEKQAIENRLVNVTEFDIYDSLYSTILRKNLDGEILKKILKDSSNGHIVNVIWNSTRNSNEDFNKVFWNVGARNVNFTGRKPILEELGKGLKLKSKAWFFNLEKSSLKFVLNGMGGVGKSWIVNEFLHQNREKFKNIFWFNSEIVDDLHNQIQELVCTFHGENFPKISSQNLVQKRMKYWLEQSCNWPWILVFDNLDKFETIQDLIPQFGGIFFVTSRNNIISWPVELTKLQIYGFTKSETYDLMEKILKYRDESEFDSLIKKLGNLPLAISNFCYFINDKRITISEFLNSKLNDKRFLEIFHSFHEKSVLSIQIGLKKIKKECPLSFEFLQVISFISDGDNYIPGTVLEKFIHSKNLGKLELFKVNQVILRYYLVKLESQNGIQVYSTHNLVQKILKFGIKNFEVLKISSDIVFTICSHSRCYEKTLVLENTDHLFLNMIEFSYKMEKINDFSKLLELTEIICKFIQEILYNYGCRITNLDRILRQFFGKMEKYIEDSFELCSSIALCSITNVFWDSTMSLRFFEKCFRIRKDKLGRNSANFENFYIFSEYFTKTSYIVLDDFINIIQEISKLVIDINGDEDCQLISIYHLLGYLNIEFHLYNQQFVKSLDYFRKASNLIKIHNLKNSINFKIMIEYIENIICDHYISEKVQSHIEDYVKIVTELVGETEVKGKIHNFYQNIAHRVFSEAEKYPENVARLKAALNYCEKLADYEKHNYSNGPSQDTLSMIDNCKDRILLKQLDQKMNKL